MVQKEPASPVAANIMILTRIKLYVLHAVRGLTRKYLLKSRRIKPVATAKPEAQSAEIVIDNDNDIDDGVDDDIDDDTVDDDDTDLISITKSDDDEE